MESADFKGELASVEAGRILLEAIERLPDGFAVFGPNFEPLLANRKSLTRFSETYKALYAGRPMLEAVTRSVRRNMPQFSDAEVENAAAAIYRNMLDGRTIDVKTDDGRIVQVTYKPLSDGRRVAISVDITDLRNRERELRAARAQADAANQSKSAFLANTSHEIRTPLNAILGLAQVLSKHELPGEAREHIASILDAGKTLTSLLNDVLDLSKIEAGKLDISPVDADLAHAMRRVLRLWRPRAEEKGLDLTLSIDSELPAVLNFDPTRLRQCVSNLVSNAIKFTAKGGVDIALRAEPAKDGASLVTIRVRDTGAGIAPDALERLFQPFHQADASISRQFGGTGLGLAITRKLAQLMGGDATVESVPGKGSTFTVTLLAGAAKSGASLARQSAAAPAADASKLSGRRVLVVDDIPINRQVAALFLRPLGCIVSEAQNGVEALQKLEREPFDVVLLDVHMPVMDGVAAIRKIREADAPWRDVKVLALTADAMSGDRERYLALGMNGYISKPINELELSTELLRVISEAGGTKKKPAARKRA